MSNTITISDDALIKLLTASCWSRSLAYYEVEDLLNKIKFVLNANNKPFVPTTISIILNNYNNEGKRMLRAVREMELNDPSETAILFEIYSYFVNDYYTGLSGERNHTSTWNRFEALRHFVSLLVEDQRMLESQKHEEENLSYKNISPANNEGYRAISWRKEG